MRRRRRNLVLALDDQRHRLTSLARQRDTLADALLTASRRLLNGGHRPSDDLVADLQSFQAGLRELGQQVGLSTEEDHRSLTTLWQHLHGPDPRQAALDIVGQAQRIRLMEGANLPGLQSFHDEARALGEQLRAVRHNDTILIDQLRTWQHPLCALLQMIQQAGEMANEQWIDTLDIIRTNYGEDLATAAARGRLTIAPRHLAPQPAACLAGEPDHNELLQTAH